jgi:hypothetical protein
LERGSKWILEAQANDKVTPEFFIKPRFPGDLIVSPTVGQSLSDFHPNGGQKENPRQSHQIL